MNKRKPKIFINNQIIESQVKYDLIDYQRKIKKPVVWPIDIEFFIESLWGVSICYEDNITCPGSDDEILGYLSVIKKEIKVNLTTNKNDGRINFTLAHEAGHASLHSTLSKSIVSREIEEEIYCRTNELGKNLTIERQANYYAINLLMPKERIFEEFNDNEVIDLNEKIIKIMGVFGVSRYVAELRLHKLGFKTVNNMYKF